LVLRRCGHIALARQIIQEDRDLGGSKLQWMALPREIDKPPDPLHVDLFGAIAVVPPSDRITQLLQ